MFRLYGLMDRNVAARFRALSVRFKEGTLEVYLHTPMFSHHPSPPFIRQIGERDARKYATLLLLSQMMREPCFTELRTKQQIG